jgi:hypothetical protein
LIYGESGASETRRCFPEDARFFFLLFFLSEVLFSFGELSGLEAAEGLRNVATSAGVASLAMREWPSIGGALAVASGETRAGCGASVGTSSRLRIIAGSAISADVDKSLSANLRFKDAPVCAT